MGSNRMTGDLEAHEPIIAAGLGFFASVAAVIAKLLRGRPKKEGMTISDLADKLDEHAESDKHAQQWIAEQLRDINGDLKEGLDRMGQSLEHVHDRLLTLERKSAAHRGG